MGNYLKEMSMKIIVASTPKTGNTWMTHLLSAIYDLPEVELPPEFDPVAADQKGTRWISLQHYYPDPALISWAERHGALFVTTMRHPGDLLVSLWHMMHNKSYGPNSDLRYLTMLLADGDEMGEQAALYVREDFYHGLYISLNWMKSDVSFTVRYEELWRDPVTVLTELTNQIQPVDPDRIESAIDLCDINMLRKLYDDPEGKFFRKGGPGDWHRELPNNIINIFRSQEPYPTLFRELGYTLDPSDPLTAAPAKVRITKNPFTKITRFDNGVNVPVIAIKLYLLSSPELKTLWRGKEAATTEGSFFAWLNAPIKEDISARDRLPIITNLTHYIYHTRCDLQIEFPDLSGTDRIAYLLWFICYAQEAYDLDDAFITSVQDALLVWGNAPAKEDECQPATAPIITNMAIYVYRIRPDLQAAFPKPFGIDRVRFARWFVTYATQDIVFDSAFIESIQSSLEKV